MKERGNASIFPWGTLWSRSVRPNASNYERLMPVPHGCFVTAECVWSRGDEGEWRRVCSTDTIQLSMAENTCTVLARDRYEHHAPRTQYSVLIDIIVKDLHYPHTTLTNVREKLP